MENQSSSGPLFEMGLNERAKQSIKATAVVAGIAAILSLSVTLLDVIIFFIRKKKVETQLEGFESDPLIGSGAGVGYIGIVISVGLSILFFYFLNRFATLCKRGIGNNNEHDVSEGLGALANYFRITGILIIIGIVLVVLFMSAILFGAAS